MGGRLGAIAVTDFLTGAAITDTNATVLWAELTLRRFGQYFAGGRLKLAMSNVN